MKNLKNLNGFKALSKQEQVQINGGGRTYCKGSNMCCSRLPNGVEFCDYGYCFGNRCVWA
ncbi:MULTISPECIES: hypothetical protein [unclassified Tenacibaculum]|uniref:hypothetical protein n=1 Tax=unclassified Tenacibaculum TaxID=2635139 RepID=UPI001F472198|nr:MULTISPECIES: hypothetical protein [unclassified Tenacibaculum]MCF2875490.1 hypothetical protein [Tenacibaculum sp. Cn5-1]MCF2935566.1 hypothetical protein [Tenacibaculum sp. Cn5-34]MCG7512126.1 hypothetical protein [Tenacibaculum sp. Cn5-46]